MNNTLKKVLLVFGLTLSLVSPALADDYDQHRRDHNHGGYDMPHRDYSHHDYGYDHGHDRFSRSFGRHELHEYHVWIFDFPPPPWLVVDPFHQVWCRDYNISTVYVNDFGVEYTVVETHIECLDAFGVWRFVR